jgi:hypothetical protein
MAILATLTNPDHPGYPGHLGPILFTMATLTTLATLVTMTTLATMANPANPAIPTTLANPAILTNELGRWVKDNSSCYLYLSQSYKLIFFFLFDQSIFLFDGSIFFSFFLTNPSFSFSFVWSWIFWSWSCLVLVLLGLGLAWSWSGLFRFGLAWSVFGVWIIGSWRRIEKFSTRTQPSCLSCLIWSGCFSQVRSGLARSGDQVRSRLAWSSLVL